MTGGEALFHALSGYQSADRDILLLAGEKMTHLGAGQASLVLSNRVNPHDRRYGASLASLAALVSRAYLSAHRVPYRSFHAVSVKNHRNALLNPKAHFHKSIDEAAVAASPVVSEPLRRLHCAPTSDGAAAALLGPGGTVTVETWAKGLDKTLFHDRQDLSRFRATRAASLAAFEQTGFRPADMDIVEIHDAFSPFELMNLEEMGFYEHGQAWRALADGELDIGGRRAVNPSGGMKARGHPIGMCGLSSVIEGFEQLTHRAGRRQQPGARLAMIQSAGGVSRESFVFILGTT
jgi:acetyl-CoA C-acetyltransferase